MGLEVKQQTVQELAQSAASYTIGGGVASFGWLADITNFAQAAAIILGCLVVAVRLIHDVRMLIKKW